MSDPLRPARSESGASSTPPNPAPSIPPADRDRRARYVDIFLYASAAISYVSLSIYNKWLLDWIVGPFWLVAWVWGLPALVKLARRQPVRPRRNPIDRPAPGATGGGAPQ